MSKKVTIKEAQGQLSQLLELAQAGHAVIIRTREKARRASCPWPSRRQGRGARLARGPLDDAPDFDAPLPDSFRLGTEA